MNPAALASDLVKADALLLEALLAFQNIFSRLSPGSPAACAVQHAMETLAVLSAATEDLASQVMQLGPENPSWN
jgi:hypothetical protein